MNINIKALLLFVFMVLSIIAGIIIGYGYGYSDGYYHGYDEGETWDNGFSNGYVTAFQISDKDKWQSKLTYQYHYNITLWPNITKIDAETSYNKIIANGLKK